MSRKLVTVRPGDRVEITNPGFAMHVPTDKVGTVVNIEETRRRVWVQIRTDAGKLYGLHPKAVKKIEQSPEVP